MISTLSRIAQKYNWWTPADKKGAISDTQKISDVMSAGTFEEVVQVFRTFDIHLLILAFERIFDDFYALKPRRRAFLRSMIDLKQTQKKYNW